MNGKSDWSRSGRIHNSHGVLLQLVRRAVQEAPNLLELPHALRRGRRPRHLSLDALTLQ